MQPITSTHLSLISYSSYLRDDATCTTRCRSSVSFEANWKNLSWLTLRWSKPLDLDACPTRSSSCRFCHITDKPSPAWFWVPNQETITVILRPKSPNRNSRFWGPNQETHAPCLLVHGTDCTRSHSTSRSSSQWVPDLCLTIPGPLYQVSYSYLDPHCCPPCRTCHIHTTR
jgi:hypothetical protein